MDKSKVICTHILNQLVSLPSTDTCHQHAQRLGIEDGRITDGQMSASSQHGGPQQPDNEGPQKARLNLKRDGNHAEGWIPGDSDEDMWIQVLARCGGRTEYTSLQFYLTKI